MRVSRMITYIALAFIVVAMGYIRLAPLDPARWHIDMTAPGFQPPSHWAAYCPRNTDRAPMSAPDPVAALQRLDSVALATPRTQRLAGSPEEGRITWVTRSRVMGFPDLTTAQVLTDADGPRLCILARQRFGRGDWGVNGNRITKWAQAYSGLNEQPDQIPF